MTADELMTFFGVLFIIFGGVITLDKVAEIVKKWFNPTMTTEKKLENDHQRLDEHDQDIKNLQESMQLLCNGVMALLEHEIHNGNSEQMQEARDSILRYLNKRI